LASPLSHAAFPAKLLTIDESGFSEVLLVVLAKGVDRQRRASLREQEADQEFLSAANPEAAAAEIGPYWPLSPERKVPLSQNHSDVNEILQFNRP